MLFSGCLFFFFNIDNKSHEAALVKLGLKVQLWERTEHEAVRHFAVWQSPSKQSIISFATIFDAYTSQNFTNLSVYASSNWLCPSYITSLQSVKLFSRILEATTRTWSLIWEKLQRQAGKKHNTPPHYTHTHTRTHRNKRNSICGSPLISLSAAP